MAKRFDIVEVSNGGWIVYDKSGPIDVDPPRHAYTDTADMMAALAEAVAHQPAPEQEPGEVEMQEGDV